MINRMKTILTESKLTRKIIGVALVAAIAVGGVLYSRNANQIPDLPVYTDNFASTEIADNEVPLGSTTSTKTSKTTSKKTVKMKKAAKRSYTKKLSPTTKTSSTTTKGATATVVKKTTVKTEVTEKYTKKSKKKTVTTTKTTTVETTTTTNSQSGGKSTIDIASIAPKAHKNVLDAYKSMGFKVILDSSVSYAGYFDGRSQSITMRAKDDNIYHELGHYVAFVAGNMDTSSSFVSIYNSEKSSYSGRNPQYVLSTSAEYFAESYREYVLTPSKLKAERPKTYEAIVNAVGKITDSQVDKYKLIFQSIWTY